MPRFEIIDHTADVAIVAYGRSLPELFENAALGMFSLIADLEGGAPNETVAVEVEAVDRESLLVAWLAELIYHYEVEHVLFKEFKVEEFNERERHGVRSLRATACGMRFALGEREILRHMKAVTYHGLKVEQTEDGWRAQVVFDT